MGALGREEGLSCGGSSPVRGGGFRGLMVSEFQSKNKKRWDRVDSDGKRGDSIAREIEESREIRKVKGKVLFNLIQGKQQQQQKE